MIKQQIIVADEKWTILIYYGVSNRDYKEVLDMLIDMGSSFESAKYAATTVAAHKNTGLTFTDMDNRFSFVCISDTNNVPQMVNTTVHEAKHVQSHICRYYDVPEDSEEAAYLIGYIVLRIYKLLSRLK